MRGRRRRWWRIALAVGGAGTAGVLALLWVYGPRAGVWLVPPSPQRYGQEAMHLLDGGLYAHGPEWAAARERALDRLGEADTLAEADAVLAEAALVAGGHHSFLIDDAGTAPAGPVAAPSVTVADGVATAVVPEFSGSAEQGQQYADTLARGLASADACGVIVDVRGNGGGDMGPMIAGIAGLLPDGVTSAFVTGEQVTELRLADGRFTGGGTPTSTAYGSATLDLPVAVLTDGGTGSAGEQVVIALRGLPDVRSFGEPTAGYASVNRTFRLYSGASLVLTVGETEDREQNRYGDRPIPPDEPVDVAAAPARAAEWLRTRCDAGGS